MKKAEQGGPRRALRYTTLLVLGLWLAGCSVVREPVPAESAAPASEAQPQRGSEALMVALGQMGVPYRRGGESHQGFDCSGLVQYAWAGAGVQLPRTAAQQYARAQKVSPNELAPGDLVFFRIDGRSIDHVGLYRGDGHFVHAPRPGRAVEAVALDNPYWSRRFAGGGRVADAADD